MVYIENDGALFRGVSRAWPAEVWNGSEFVPYDGSVPKPVDWGDVISDAEAKALMGDGADVKAPAAADPAAPAPKAKVAV